jgi:hypothetical protein
LLIPLTLSVVTGNMSDSDSSSVTHAPFQHLTADNHGPVIIVTTFIFLLISILAVIVKIWTRLATTRKLASTDYTILLSTVSLRSPIVGLR